MTKLVDLPSDVHKKRLTHGFFEDFDHLVSADRWTSVLTDSGSATVGDAAGGVVTVTASDGSVVDNDQAYIHTTTELFKFAANKPLVFEARVQYAEANTDDANVLIGLMDGIAAEALVDDGGGPKSSYSGAVFYKVDGGTRWQVEVSDSTTQDTVDLTAANSFDGVAKTAGGSAYQTLRIEFMPTTGDLGDVSFFIDDILVYKFKDYDFGNATEMDVVFGVKNGSANNESLAVDYVGCHQTR